MKRFSWRILALLLGAMPAFAGAITYNCDSSLGAANTAGTECNTLTTTVAGQYASLFTNANATIYVSQTSLSGDVADNTQIYNTVNYFNYYAALKASESGPNDVTAVNSLGSPCVNFTCTNPVTGSTSVNLTGPLESALGIGTPKGICFLTSGGCNNNENDSTYGSCVLGSSNCYNDVIDVGTNAVLNPGSGQYDFVTAVEHETDEALGTSSCLNVNQNTNAPQNSCGSAVSAADFFRYSASGTRSFLGTNGNQAKGSLAYFSINGGLTNLVDYNNTNNGDDYGDFSNSIPCGMYVQDAEGCPGKAGVTIGNDGGIEVAMLDAVGYTLTPEPSSIVMALAGLGFIASIARRRSRARG